VNERRYGTKNLLERTNALNLVTGMNDGRSPTLGAHEHNVHQLWCRGHGLYAFKVVNGHDDDFDDFDIWIF
jgi:hypothetical protein